ncbi:CocE/NonD family hydrolase [Isosphaeraceae bacterium EP7]
MRRPSRVPFTFVVALAAWSLAGHTHAQGIEYVRAHYTKYEYKVPMRDGVKLFTAVYVPKDDSKTYPILLNRTPYSVAPYGTDKPRENLGPSALFGKEGYIFAYQDVRGRWMSEGEFVHMRPYKPEKAGKEIDESSDTYDTIAWLLEHVRGHNGKVGQSGISYPGFYTTMGMINAHPSLIAASPQAPVADWFVGDDWHHNGALFLAHAFNFMANVDKPHSGPTKKPGIPFDHGTPDGYDFFLRLGPLSKLTETSLKDVPYWKDIVGHPDYDAFWKASNVLPHIKNIKPAVLNVGGWFDAENLYGILETYKAVEKSSAETPNTLVMGPWLHGGWAGGDGASLGHVGFDAKTSEFYRETIEFPFFQKHLKGATVLEFPKAWVFETGHNRWRKFAQWPPADVKARALYLGDSGTLLDSPASTDAPAADDYVSDPDRPVPHLDRVNIGMTGDYMIGDQRFASRRPDVLVYQSEVLEEDLTIAGPVTAELHVSTTGTDSDWVVKLIDVYPNDFPDPNPNPTGVRMGGFQQLVRGDVMRGKYRDGHFSDPQPFEPGKPTPLNMAMNDTLHTFRAGHKVMVQIQSSWFPLVDRNPQTFADIYSAKPGDYRRATQTIHRSKVLPSKVTINVLAP